MRIPVALAAAVLLAVPATAQPSETPTLELRSRSLTDWLGAADTLAPLSGPPEQAQRFRDGMKQLGSEMAGLEGFDRRRPLGASVTLRPGVVESSVVVMLPITDEAQVLRTIQDRWHLTPEMRDGVYHVEVPILRRPLHFRFAQSYLVVSVRASDLDVKALPRPAAFLGKPEGLASIVLRLDRVPKEIKRAMLGQLELRLHDARKPREAAETPAQRKLQSLVLDAAMAAVQAIADDGKDVTFRLDVTPATDDLLAELRLTAKPGSALARTLQDAGARKSWSAAVAADANAVAHIGLNWELPERYKPRYAEAVQAILASQFGPADETNAGRERLAGALLPTLTSGTFNLAATLLGPDANTHHGLRLGVHVEEGQKIVILLKNLSLFLPDSVATFSFDKETVGDFALHAIEAKAAGAAFEKLFGGRTIWLATSPEHFALSVEKDGAHVRERLQAKPTAAPLLTASASLAPLAFLTEQAIPADKIQGLVRKVFGTEAVAGRDRLSLVIEGGDGLSVRLRAKGKGLAFWTQVNAARAN